MKNHVDTMIFHTRDLCLRALDTNSLCAKNVCRNEDKMKVVIVGGVAGGATAATRIRRLDENAQIIVIERTGYISYANCGLPYYIGGVIEDKDDLTLQTPESFLERFQIDVRVEQEVTGIDASKKTVTIKRLDNGQEYDCLLYTSDAADEL